MEKEDVNISIRNAKTNLNIKLKPNNPNNYRNTNTLSFKSRKSINLINKSSKKIPNNSYIKKLEREQYYKYSSSQDTSSKENSFFLEEESNKGYYIYNNINDDNNKHNISIDFNLNKRLSTISNLTNNKNKKYQSHSNDKNTCISFKNKIVNANKNYKNTNKEDKLRKQNLLFKLIENYHKAKSKKERQYNIDAYIKDNSDNNSDSNKKSLNPDNNTNSNTQHNTIPNNSSNNNNPVYSNLSLWKKLYSKFVSKNSLKSTKISLDEIKFRIKFTLNNEYFSSDLYNNNNSNDNNNISNKNDGNNYDEGKETFITSNNKKELLERKHQLFNEKNSLVPLIIRLIQQINIDDLVNNEKKEDGNEINKKEERVFSYKEFLENRKKKKNFVRSVVNFAGNKSSICSSIDFSKKNNKSEIIKYKTLGCSSLFNNSINISKNNSRHRDSISYSLNKLGNNNNNYLNSIINRNNNNNNNLHFSIKTNRVNSSISSFVKNNRIIISNTSNTRNSNIEDIKSKTNNIPNKNYLRSNTRMNDLYFNRKSTINNKNKFNKRLSKSNKEILQFIDRFKQASSKEINYINSNTSNINFKTKTKSFSKIDIHNNNYNINKTKVNTCEAFRKISNIEYDSINDSFRSNIFLDKRFNNKTEMRKSNIKSSRSNSNSKSKSICISSSSKSNDKSGNISSIINKKISGSEYELVKYESKSNLLKSNNNKSLLRCNKKKVTINTRENIILVTENDKKLCDNSKKKKLTFTSSLFCNSTHFNNTHKKILNGFTSSNLNSNDKDNSTIATNSTILSILSNNNNTKSRVEDLFKKKTIDNIKLKKKLTHINRTKPQRLNSINSSNANNSNNINNKNKKLTSHNFNIYSLKKNCKSNTKIINIHSDTTPTFKLDLNSISQLKIENKENTIIKNNKLNSGKKYLNYEDKIKLKDYKLIDQITKLNFNDNINSINDIYNTNNMKIGNTKRISLLNSNNSTDMNLDTINTNSTSNYKLNSSFKKKNSTLLSNTKGFANSKNVYNHLISNNTNTTTNNVNNKNIKLSPTQIRININNLESLKMDIKAFEKEINIAESKGLFKLHQYKAIEHLINSEKIKSCLSKMTFKYENTFKTKIGINSNNYGIIFDDMTKPKFHKIFNDEVMLNKLVDCEKIMTVVKKYLT